MLRLGGPREKLAVQRGIWAPIQHLLYDTKKQRKSLDQTGRSQAFSDAY